MAVASRTRCRHRRSRRTSTRPRSSLSRPPAARRLASPRRCRSTRRRCRRRGCDGCQTAVDQLSWRVGGQPPTSVRRSGGGRRAEAGHVGTARRCHLRVGAGWNAAGVHRPRRADAVDGAARRHAGSGLAVVGAAARRRGAVADTRRSVRRQPLVVAQTGRAGLLGLVDDRVHGAVSHPPVSRSRRQAALRVHSSIAPG